MRYIIIIFVMFLIGCNAGEGMNNCNKKLNHNWSNWSEPSDTHSIVANQVKTCSVCNKVIQRQLSN